MLTLLVLFSFFDGAGTAAGVVDTQFPNTMLMSRGMRRMRRRNN